MPALLATTMVLSSAHVALPRPPSGTSAIVAACPPAIDTLLIVLPTQNPIDEPSVEKNGATPPSVPGIGVAVSRSSARAYSCAALLRTALNTASRPSGEIASACRTGREETFELVT